MDDATSLGMSEQELRNALSEELTLAFRTEQNTATIHAIAHSIARVIALDHLRVAEQLEREGIRLRERSGERPDTQTDRASPSKPGGAQTGAARYQ